MVRIDGVGCSGSWGERRTRVRALARFRAANAKSPVTKSLVNLLVPSLSSTTPSLFFPTPILAYTATKGDFFRMNHIDALFHSLDIRRFEKQFLNGNPG